MTRPDGVAGSCRSGTGRLRLVVICSAVAGGHCWLPAFRHRVAGGLMAWDARTTASVGGLGWPALTAALGAAVASGQPIASGVGWPAREAAWSVRRSASSAPATSLIASVTSASGSRGWSAARGAVGASGSAPGPGDVPGVSQDAAADPGPGGRREVTAAEMAVRDRFGAASVRMPGSGVARSAGADQTQEGAIAMRGNGDGMSGLGWPGNGASGNGSRHAGARARALGALGTRPATWAVDMEVGLGWPETAAVPEGPREPRATFGARTWRAEKGRAPGRGPEPDVESIEGARVESIEGARQMSALAEPYRAAKSLPATAVSRETPLGDEVDWSAGGSIAAGRTATGPASGRRASFGQRGVRRKARI